MIENWQDHMLAALAMLGAGIEGMGLELAWPEHCSTAAGTRCMSQESLVAKHFAIG